MNMHWCTAWINQAGQGIHIFEVLYTRPMSWPELQLLMEIHGQENIYDIKPIAISDTDPASEKRRLIGKYDTKGALIEQTFPGRDPNMKLLVPGEPEDQPLADEYGAPVKMFDDDELPGSAPPASPAIMKPGITRTF
jgi:hypothetical protein